MSRTLALLPRIITALALCAWNIECSPAPTAKEDALARLAPENTVVFVRAASLDGLLAASRQIGAAAAREGAAELSIEQLLATASVPGAPKQIDRTKPIAICMVLPAEEGAALESVYLVPAVSGKKYADSVVPAGGTGTARIEGEYVLASASAGMEPAKESADLAVDLPDGDLVVRVDLARVCEHYRTTIDAGLGMVEAQMQSLSAAVPGGVNMAPALELYVDFFRAILDSGESFDLAMRLNGSRLELAGALTAREGSSLASYASKEKTSARALARYLDPDAAFSAVLGADMAAMTKRLRPMVDAVMQMYPEPLRASFGKMMEHNEELAAEMGSGSALSLDIGAGGVRFASYMRPRDSAKLLEIYQSMMRSMPGLAIDEMQEAEVEGMSVMRSRMRLDSEALAAAAAGAGEEATNPDLLAMLDSLYGEDGLAFTYATNGDVTALVLGGDENFLHRSVGRMSSSRKTSLNLTRPLEEVGGENPCFVVHYDVGRLMRGMQELLVEVLPDALPIVPSVETSVDAWGCVDGRVWRGAFSTDLGELAAAQRALSQPPGEDEAANEER
jgi:hypothetical protein